MTPSNSVMTVIKAFASLVVCSWFRAAFASGHEGVTLAAAGVVVSRLGEGGGAGAGAGAGSSIPSTAAMVENIRSLQGGGGGGLRKNKDKRRKKNGGPRPGAAGAGGVKKAAQRSGAMGGAAGGTKRERDERKGGQNAVDAMAGAGDGGAVGTETSGGPDAVSANALNFNQNEWGGPPQEASGAASDSGAADSSSSPPHLCASLITWQPVDATFCRTATTCDASHAGRIGAPCMSDEVCDIYPDCMRFSKVDAMLGAGGTRPGVAGPTMVDPDTERCVHPDGPSGSTMTVCTTSPLCRDASDPIATTDGRCDDGLVCRSFAACGEYGTQTAEDARESMDAAAAAQEGAGKEGPPPAAGMSPPAPSGPAGTGGTPSFQTGPRVAGGPAGMAIVQNMGGVAPLVVEEAPVMHRCVDPSVGPGDDPCSLMACPSQDGDGDAVCHGVLGYEFECQSMVDLCG